MAHHDQSRLSSPPPLLWEYQSSRAADYLPEAQDGHGPESDPEIAPLRRQGRLRIPELSELQVIRHFKALASANFSIDRFPYPLGSCTMKYNPKVSEALASRQEFTKLHPKGQSSLAMALLWELQDYLKKLTGFAGISLQPAAGAQAEYAGLLMIRAALKDRGELETRRKIIIPDSAHGTNPASASMAGFQTLDLKTGPGGRIRMKDLQPLLDTEIAGIMITNPNTLGIFEDEILEISSAIHDIGAYVYGDGANYNALAGKIRPAELGLDLMHINVHKTFGTPHGGGGPGAGPLCAAESLRDYLPGPIVERLRTDEGLDHVEWMPPKSIGRLHEAWGNFAILLRALAYLWGHGIEGIRANSEQAVINANYLKALLKDSFPAAYEGECMHEFVASNPLKEQGISTLDIAKRLLDHGIHAPTVYFPLIVKEALMIEPTESEALEDLNRMAQAFIKIAEEAKEDPELLRSAPRSLPFSRVNETEANRKLRLSHPFE